jgi:alpha-N-arabinofuranosidase
VRPACDLGDSYILRPVFEFQERQSENKVNRMQRVKLAGFVVESIFWLGAASAIGQIMDDTHAAPDQPVHVRVHASELQKEAIPPTIFGSFLEPIGHSTYGGLWSELLENPSFEEGLWSAGAIARMIKERPELEPASKLDLPLPWEPLDVRQGNRYEPQTGDAANSSNSLLIMGLPAGEVGIRQRIYLPVRRILTYRGSVYIKHQSGPGKVYISLRNRNDVQTVFATTTIDAAGKEWTRYSFELTLKPGMVGRLQPVDFVIALRDDARAYIDQVSLTWS